MSASLLVPLLVLSASASPVLFPRQATVNSTTGPTTNTTTPSNSTTSTPSSQNYANSTSTIVIEAPVITKETVKRGVAWPNADWLKMDLFAGGNVSWYYTWNPSPAKQSKALDIAYVPMLWGPGQAEDFVSQSDSGWTATLLTPNKEILAFNEPNLKDQASLEPNAAARIWIQDLEPLRAKGFRLGAPVTTNAPDGVTWMKSFLAACNGSCTPDFYPLHWYSTEVDSFKAYVQQWHDTFHAPIWVTEFAFHGFNKGDKQLGSREISDALAECQTFLQETEYVERYSFFGAMLNVQGINPLNALMQNVTSPENPSGTIGLSKLGVQYLGGPMAGEFDKAPGIESQAPVGTGGGGGQTGQSGRKFRVGMGVWVGVVLAAMVC